MYQLPTELEFNGTVHKIRNKGDYRIILDCFLALNDSELTKEERVYACLIIFYEDLNSLEDILSLESVDEPVKKMFDFFRCNQPETVQTAPYALIDWETDEQMICAAVNTVAHEEIRSAPYIHWWTFMGYYNSIGKSVLSTVVSIRNKIMKGKKLEKWETEFRRENPQYFAWKAKSADEIKEDEEIKALWNSNS